MTLCIAIFFIGYLYTGAFYPASFYQVIFYFTRMPDSSQEDLMERQLGACIFLSQLFSTGLTEALYEVAGNIPSLAEHLPASFDADEAAVAHQDLFGFNVLPHAGVFLSEDGKLGGDIDFQCNRFYEAFSFESLPESPDHISTQLAFLAHLLDLRMTSPEASSPLLQARFDFLYHHLMPWVNTFLFALKGQNNAFYAEIADLTQVLLFNQLKIINAKAAITHEISYFHAPPPDILENKKTGMKQIALFLLRPLHSGIYLSKHEIQAISRSMEVPTGFGDRGQLLSNLFQAALNFDTFSHLIDQLKARTLAFKQHYESINEKNTPAISTNLKPWIDRTSKTLKILGILQTQKIEMSEE